MTAYNQAK